MSFGLSEHVCYQPLQVGAVLYRPYVGWIDGRRGNRPQRKLNVSGQTACTTPFCLYNAVQVIIHDAKKDKLGPSGSGKLPYSGSPGPLVREQRVAAVRSVSYMPALHSVT
jgi:hypothetical protein